MRCLRSDPIARAMAKAAAVCLTGEYRSFDHTELN